MKLTHQQKLDALAYRFYQDAAWAPRSGDFYTTSRADLELYQVVSVDNGIVRTRYTEGSDTVSEWPESGFLTEGFGPKRVFVPGWVLSTERAAPASPDYSDGWLFLNPDTGTEWSKQHPIASGEVPDAENIRPATATNFLNELMPAWEDLAKTKAALSAAQEEIERRVLSALVASPQPVAGWRPMESAPKDGTLVDLWLEPFDAFECGNAHRRPDARFKNGRWEIASSGVGLDTYWRATRWMERPAAPTAPSRGRAMSETHQVEREIMLCDTIAEQRQRIASLETSIADLAPHAARIASLSSALSAAQEEIERLKRERDEARSYAERLATILHEKHWRDEAPQWRVLSGDLIGVLTQIDNMTAGLVRRTALQGGNDAE